MRSKYGLYANVKYKVETKQHKRIDVKDLHMQYEEGELSHC